MIRRYREEWVKAGYQSTMGSAEVVPPPKDPAFIRVYHFTTSEFAISDIGLARLKVARFSDLNDPFELLAPRYSDPERRAAIREFKRDYDAVTGLLCFSRNWTNPILWSHYAAKHTGVCLGFDLRRSCGHIVQYEPSRLQQELESREKTAVPDEFKEVLIKTKFKHWEYEEEIRFIIPLEKATKEGVLHFFEFNEDLKLSEVVLGSLCTMNISKIRSLVSKIYENVKTFQSRLALKTFNIVPKESTVN